MTPTEKDAMALAVLDKWSDTEERRCNHKSPGKCSVCIQRREARAHLASRIAELEQALTFARQARDVAMHEMQQSDARATRAEAELAAVRKLPAMILHDSWAGTANRLSRWAKLPDNKNVLSGQTMEEAAAFIRHYIDAARGGE